MNEKLMAAQEQDEQVRQDRIFELTMEDFSRRYRPADPYEGSRFDMQLHTLVRQIYREAQQPLLNQITKMIGASLDLSNLMPRAQR